jgi:hypothetical protein
MNTIAQIYDNTTQGAQCKEHNSTVAVILFIVQSAVKWIANFCSNTAYCAQCYEHTSTMLH